MLEKAEKQARLLEQSNAELDRAKANEDHLRQALAEKNQERFVYINYIDLIDCCLFHNYPFIPFMKVFFFYIC